MSPFDRRRPTSSWATPTMSGTCFAAIGRTYQTRRPEPPPVARGSNQSPDSYRLAGDLDDARRPLRRVHLARMACSRRPRSTTSNNVLDVFLFDAESQWAAATRHRLGDRGGSGGLRARQRPHRVADAERRRPLRLVAVRGDQRRSAAAAGFEAQLCRGPFSHGTATRVSLKPDGTEPDRERRQAAISADGSLVAFVSRAFNLTPNAYTDVDRVYAAVHFEITPEEQSVSGAAGGAATYDVVTQQHTPWWIDWNEWQPWTDFEAPPMGFGSGMVKIRANEANPNPTPRTAQSGFSRRACASRSSRDFR